MERQQQRKAPNHSGEDETKPPLGSEAQVNALKRFVDQACGRPIDIALSLDNARAIYFQLNPTDTDADFQRWLDSLPEEE